MKILTFVLFAFLIASCSNKKAEIVEQIKSYKDSSRTTLDSIVKLTVNETLKYEELYFTNGKTDYNKVGDPGLRKIYSDYETRNDSIEWELKMMQSHFKYKIDSLELELKKY